MDAASLPWIIIAGLGGVVVAMVGYWAKAQIERMGSVESRADQREQIQTERVIDHTGDIARLQADVANLKDGYREERQSCSELRERCARVEAFQAWAEPLLERAVRAIEQANADRARDDERFTTLFKSVGAIVARFERMQQQLAAAG
jgi:predicted RNase H-like nuclease (RuvC/YqgF family)